MTKINAEFISSTGLVHSGEIIDQRQANIPICHGLIGLVDGNLKYTAKLPAYVRIRTNQGVEIEVHPSRIEHLK